MAVLLHLLATGGDEPDLLRSANALIAALSQQAVPLALLAECSSAEGAALLPALQPQAAKAGAALLGAQQSQLAFALRSVLMQLGCAPQHVLAVSLCAAPAPPAALAAAAAAGCGATLHLPPGDPGAAALAVLQRFATLQQALTGCLVVGYVMKRSRQLSLGVEGMLPLLPLDGLCFMPLDPALPLAQQQPFDILLQKPTDFLEEVPGSGRVPGFTPPLRTLNSQLAQRSAAGSASGRGGVVVIDPLERVQGVLDRAALAALLDGVCAEAAAAGVRLRSPRWTLLEAGQEQEAAQQLAAAGLHLPLIVKPQVACGVSEAHQMAFVLGWAGLQGLEVPLPAVAQEYVDHGGLVWKVYVAGDKVFMAQRKSTPDLVPLACHLAVNPEADVPSSIAFDSLKSLPTSLPWARQLEQQAAGPAGASGGQRSPSRTLEQGTAELVARLLRQRLELTLFGFDIVISDAGELVVIDVNFFPSFKGVPEAPQALRQALLAAYAAAQPAA